MVTTSAKYSTEEDVRREEYGVSQTRLSAIAT
jgi:hypothetical protein